MAIFPISDRYRIELDEYSWAIAVYTPRKDKNRKQWTQSAWFRTLNQAAEHLRDKLTDESDAKHLDEAIAAVRDSAQLVAAAIERAGIPDSWLEAKKASEGLSQ